MKRELLGCACFVSAAVFPILAHAQEPAAEEQRNDGEREEDAEARMADIVVTAERRETSVQRTPLAISAVGGEDLRERNISNVEDLSLNIPNVTFTRIGASASLTIRGLGYSGVQPGGESRAAIYSDGIYQSRTQSALLGFYDVDRVEVLRGPQGTLYGRNSVAGAMNIITRKPGDELNGYLTGEVGEYGLFSTEGAIGGPLGEGVGARLAFRTVDRDGYGEFIDNGSDVNDEKSRSVRGSLAFEPTSNFRFNLTADYVDVDDHSGGFRDAGRGNNAIPTLVELRGSVTPSDPQDAAGIRPLRNIESWGLTAEANLDLSESTTVTLLTGYRDFEYSQDSSIDGSTEVLAPIYTQEDAETFTTELRLAHQFGEFADIIVGAYYFDETSLTSNQVTLKGLVFSDAFGVTGFVNPNDLYEFYGAFGEVKTEAYAVFGQLNLYLTDKWELDLGLRYSHEQKDLDEQYQLDILTPFVRDNPLNTSFNPAAGLLGGEQMLTQTWNSLDPKLTLSYQATEDLYLYATYSQGFKSGGYNIGGLQPAFDPEKLVNYEAGVKADVFDNRARINLSVFNYDYEDLQESIIVGATIVTTNATEASVRGAEAEITARPVDDLLLALNIAYLDGEFDEFVDFDPAFAALGNQDLEGNQLPNAPKWQVGGEINYTFHTRFGDITPRASATWYDKIYFNHFNTEESSQEERTMVNLSVGWESLDGNWQASAYAKNLTDDTYITGTNVNTPVLGFQRTAAYGAPRTVGVRVTRLF